MPEMDGFAFVESIKRNPEWETATIMMLSSASQRGDARRCRELGVAAYLTKPVRQAELLDAILTALGTKPKKQTRPALSTRHSLREDHGHLNILLVEDNAVNQLLAQRMLEKRGHTITVATNGKEALAALREKSFQLVFMDVQMPVMDGFATTEAIRGMEKNSGNHVPIVAYLSKPIFPDELNEVLKRYLPAESKVLKSV
jgi:CheY-like chemotaxis protein